MRMKGIKGELDVSRKTKQWLTLEVEPAVSDNHTSTHKLECVQQMPASRSNGPSSYQQQRKKKCYVEEDECVFLE